MQASKSASDRCPTCHRRYRRNNQQNALYWLTLHAIADKVKPEGKSYSPEHFHMYFKSRFIGCDDFTLPNGKVMTIPKSSAALDIAEFADYLTKVQAWAAERDVYLDSLEGA